MVVAAIFHFDTVPGAVTCEFVVLANCTVFTHAVELAIQAGTINLEIDFSEYFFIKHYVRYCRKSAIFCLFVCLIFRPTKEFWDIEVYSPVETVLGDDSALGPLLSVVETGAVFCQNAPVVCLTHIYNIKTRRKTNIKYAIYVISLNSKQELLQSFSSKTNIKYVIYLISLNSKHNLLQSFSKDILELILPLTFSLILL